LRAARHDRSLPAVTTSAPSPSPRTGSEPVRFALFDWLDESGRGLGETYEERLQALELADRLGYYCYHLAEHHSTELSTVPSPNLFLSAVAQRTKRLRLGPLSYILPIYDPLRLLEEICMLDQLSGGRLEVGLSRGSTGELIDNDPDKARAMFNEVLDVILMGLASGQLDYHGRYFDYDGAFTRLRPVQRPYPPLWYPTSNVESIPWVAAQGLSTAFSVHLTDSFDKTADMVRRYRAAYAARPAQADGVNGYVARPHYGFSVHVHVAETDELAFEQMRPAYERFVHNYTYRMIRRGQPERYANRTTFDRQRERGLLLVGSPATVRRQLGEWLEQSGANYVLGCFTFGSLTLEQTARSLELFAREVIPALSVVAPRRSWRKSSGGVATRHQAPNPAT
jgi:alkanesulfonate monooxygenase SsuD/methylene tetrahydromethanopterin reductase-like flavin-dependent oxidoreductase (luciferase family)